MNIYMSDDGIKKATYDLEPTFNAGRIDSIDMDRALMKASANHAVKEVFDYLNVKDLKVMVNRLSEVGLMIKEMDNE
uniref:Uncharacterized protein n=1 Tax=viral metagenome TaxID=1070528 RepID=A0A6H1ZFJ5_9ZZZZ